MASPGDANVPSSEKRASTSAPRKSVMVSTPTSDTSPTATEMDSSQTTAPAVSQQPRKSVMVTISPSADPSEPRASQQPRKSMMVPISSDPSNSTAAVDSSQESATSQPRNSIVSSNPSQPRKSIVPSDPSQPRMSIAPSDPSQPRKSIASSDPSQPRKSIVPPGSATGSTEQTTPQQPQSPTTTAPPGSTPPSRASQSGPQGSSASQKAPQPSGPVADWDYSTPLPSKYFRPSLTDLCYPILGKNFAKYPGFGNLPADERLRVVGEIPLDLNLQLAADIIPEEPYWKRRVQARWRNCDIDAHGRSWKQLFFERNLGDALERFDRTEQTVASMEKLIVTSAPFVHGLDISRLPSHFSFLLLINKLKSALAHLKVKFGYPRTGWDYDLSECGMRRSDCLSLSAAFGVAEVLTTLHLSDNRITPEMMGILAKGMIAHPTVVDLDLSCNLLGDEGVKEVAKVINAYNSVLGMISLASNHITAKGCAYLAECEDINRTLLSMNLCFNKFGDLGGKRILDWLNNNTVIQRLSLESCDIGEDSCQSFVRLMHNTHGAITSINMSGNHAIGVKNGELLLNGLEAGKQMKELWISNCGCGEELESRILTFLVERLFGRTCFHHPGVREQTIELISEKAPEELTEEAKKKTEEEAKKKAEEEAEEEEEEEEEEDEEKKKEKADKAAQEEAAAVAAAAAAAAIEEAEAAAKKSQEEMIHVGHGHDEACTLECSHMVGLPSTKPPPEPVVYSETAYAARDAQAAIEKIQDAKPYWGLQAIKDLKEKGPE